MTTQKKKVGSNFSCHTANIQDDNCIANECTYCLLGTLFIHSIIHSTIY